MNDGDDLGPRLWLFGMVSISWSLSDEFGHALCCDPVSQISRKCWPKGYHF